ncbi:hypothetical protein K445DRAFT_182940 [Daldinia sp. EC12]|nr:hypothetical protein K445DRAFT_182940 [Daldinia sp. EC12]
MYLLLRLSQLCLFFFLFFFFFSTIFAYIFYPVIYLIILCIIHLNSLFLIESSLLFREVGRLIWSNQPKTIRERLAGYL